MKFFRITRQVPEGGVVESFLDLTTQADARRHARGLRDQGETHITLYLVEALVDRWGRGHFLHALQAGVIRVDWDRIGERRNTHGHARGGGDTPGAFIWRYLPIPLTRSRHSIIQEIPFVRIGQEREGCDA